MSLNRKDFKVIILKMLAVMLVALVSSGTASADEVTGGVTGENEVSDKTSIESIELVGVLEIAGDAKDKSGLSQVLEDLLPVPPVVVAENQPAQVESIESPRASIETASIETQSAAGQTPLTTEEPALELPVTNDMMGGFSGIAYSGHNDIYYFLPDRGPQDGAVDWSCRFQTVRLKIAPIQQPAQHSSQQSTVTAELLATTLLKDKSGKAFTGLSTSIGDTDSVGRRFDPEGIRVGDNGNIFVSDEYGPRLIEFSPQGEMVRELPIHPKFVVKNPSHSKSRENVENVSGRQSNRGMEGLAISTNKQTLFGLMQSPLLQDCYTDEVTQKPLGLNCRLMQMTIGGEPEKEMVYQLDAVSNKLNEVLAVDSNTFVVIERDGEVGAAAQFKKLMLVSTEFASDVTDVAKFHPTELPAGITPVRKSVLIDLLDPKWKLAGDAMPEKIEGLAFGPDLRDGRRTLLVGSDNDFLAANPSCVYVFAVPSRVLATQSAKKSVAMKMD